MNQVLPSGEHKEPEGLFDKLCQPLVDLLEPHKGHWIVDNIAMILTVSRIMASPVITVALWMNPRQNPIWLIPLLVAMFVTDLLDGVLARGLGQVTWLGKLLDPIGDKIVTIGLVLDLAKRFNDPIFWAQAMIIVTIEIALGTVGPCTGFLARSMNLPKLGGATWPGKCKFGFECGLLLVGWGLKPTPDVLLAVQVMAFVTIPLCLLSLRSYLMKFKALREFAGRNLTVRDLVDAIKTRP